MNYKFLKWNIKGKDFQYVQDIWTKVFLRIIIFGNGLCECLK